MRFKTIGIVEWAEKNITAEYGPYDPKKHPGMKEVMHAAATMRGGIVGILGPTQVWKSFISQILVMYLACVRPQRIGMYDLTNDGISQFYGEKFSPLIQSTEQFKSKIPQVPGALGSHSLKTLCASILSLSQGPLTSRNSKSFQTVVADESWAYKSGVLDQIKDRTKSHQGKYLMYLPSTGATENTKLDEWWNQSTQMTWHVPCEKCGEYFPYTWKTTEDKEGVPQPGGMKWAPKHEWCSEDGKHQDILYVKNSARYECPHCGHLHEYSKVLQNEMNLKGKYISMNPNGDPKLDFYHINAMATQEWPDLVQEFISAKNALNIGDLGGLENFVRKSLAEVWRMEHIPDQEATDNVGDYYIADEWNPAGKVVDLMTVDVQKDHFYAVIRRWNWDGKFIRSRLLHAGKFWSIDHVVDMADKFNIPHNYKSKQVRIGIDTGYNVPLVEKICMEYNLLRIRALGGVAKDFKWNDGKSHMVSGTEYLNVSQGTSNVAGYIPLIKFYKRRGLEKWFLLKGNKDDEDQSTWTIPKDASKEYKEQLGVYIRIQKTGKDGGIHYDFQNRKPKDDHYSDCEIMQLAMIAKLGWI